MAGEYSQAILDHMYSSGEWSDLTIVAGDRHFKVHKSVVCHGCPFLKAACTRDWKEARTGIINLPEDDGTVDELLRHLYGMQIKYYAKDPRYDDAQYMLNLAIVADKYQMSSLVKECQEDMTRDSIPDTMWEDHLEALVDLGVQLYSIEIPAVVTDAMLADVVAQTARCVAKILSEPPLWSKLVKHEQYHRDVMRLLEQCATATERSEWWRIVEKFKPKCSGQELHPTTDLQEHSDVQSS